MKNLFDHTQFAGIKLKNRFVRSATYDGLADERGHMTEELFQSYENLAMGGVGTIITGLTSVTDTSSQCHAKCLSAMIHSLTNIRN